jgi:hypothetical protein
MPAIDFVSAGRAQARVYDALNSGLDSMFKFATEKATAQAKLDAARYSFENPVTAQQIQDAVSQGRDISEIVGDPTTVFGAVTSATAVQQLTTELEIEANKKINQYQAAIKAGILYEDGDITAMKNDLANMITGHTDLIASIDVSAGLKYNASANTSASTLYASALEKNLLVKRAVKVSDAEELLSNLPDMLRNILTQKDVDMDVAIGKATTLARLTSDAMVQTGDVAFAKSKFPEIQQIVKDTYIGVLSDHVMDLPEQQRISALRSGNVGSLTPLYVLLSSTEQAEFRANVRTEIAARQQADDQLEADNLKTANQDLVVDVQRKLDLKKRQTHCKI